ncbi:MAG: DUF222 domain-containing protein [Actinobacteria bacterium]|nr:DUF222 domain-containing protein [Actinomycetota bacterium]
MALGTPKSGTVISSKSGRAFPIGVVASEDEGTFSRGGDRAGEASSISRDPDIPENSSSTSSVTVTTQVGSLLRQTPGISVLTELLEIDPYTLPRSERIDYLAALERQSSWLQAAMQRAIVAVAGDEPSRADEIWGGVDEAEREDVATALRLSGSTAQSRIDIARTLVNHLPNTCSALSTGEISPAHATVIARETASAIRDGLAPLAIHLIEEKALSHAEFHTPSQVANKVRSTLAKFAPEDFENAVTTARDTRRVSCYRESDGMSTIVAILPAEDAQLVMAAIESFVLLDSREGADRDLSSSDNPDWTRNSDLDSAAPRDGRSMDMKRADALTAIASWALARNADDVRPHRRPITINVTIDLPTLMGLSENPGQLAGYGAIPASLARSLAAEGKWRRFITDPTTGALLDFGRESYEPPQALVDFLLARDRTCRFPGCRAPARLGDLDHAQSWESGGETSAQNLGALCRRHHRLKTHGGWQLKSESDGSCLWTSPHGKEYIVPARDIQEAV